MEERIKKLIKPLIVFAAIVFLVCYLIKKPATISDATSYLGYAISATSILFLVYEQWLWKYIPWNRPFIFKKQYSGRIEYIFGGEQHTKNVNVDIKQTLHFIGVQITSDINKSKSITAEIVTENHGEVLYYTYQTDPTVMSQGNNPIQHGTCRMDLSSTGNTIRGKYWTSQQTVGDIYWTEE